MKPLKNKTYNDYIRHVKPMADYPGVSDMLSLLNAAIDLWKEALVDAKGDDVIELQGAIKRVRDVIADLHRKLPERAYKDGAYTGD